MRVHRHLSVNLAAGCERHTPVTGLVAIMKRDSLKEKGISVAHASWHSIPMSGTLTHSMIVWWWWADIYTSTGRNEIVTKIMLLKMVKGIMRISRMNSYKYCRRRRRKTAVKKKKKVKEPEEIDWLYIWWWGQNTCHKKYLGGRQSKKT